MDPVKLFRSCTFLESFICIMVSMKSSNVLQEYFPVQQGQQYRQKKNVNGCCFSRFIAELEYAFFSWIKNFLETGVF